MAANVKVVARIRPPSVPEGGSESYAEVVLAVDGTQNIRLPRVGDRGTDFTFDHVFSMDSRQDEVFEYSIRQTVNDVLNGYNGTILAYGQTGSGKTHTMMGPSIRDPDLQGITPRITDLIFQCIMHSPPTLEYLVKVSYMEIYMERVRDLLVPDRDNLQVHEDRAGGVYVQGLSEYYVGNADEVFQILHQGGVNRAVSSTRMNTESSRSHSIFCFTIQQRSTETGSTKSGSLYLVDLAGSEKVGKTGASGQTLEEAKKINRSLSVLGMVINALTDGKSSHIPYRDSKLTRILQESLGGNSRTTLIVNCSPVAYNAEETLSTLRFGVRAKAIRNNARVNAELSPEELRTLLRKANAQASASKHYAESLQAELEEWRAGRPVPMEEWIKFRTLPSGGRSSPEKTDGVQPETPTALADDSHATLDTLLSEVKSAREQAAASASETRAIQSAHDSLKLQVDELTFSLASVKEERDQILAELESQSSKTSRSQFASEYSGRLDAMLADLAVEHRPGVDTMLGILTQYESKQEARISQDDLQQLREKIMEEHLALVQQIQLATKSRQEVIILQQQKATLHDKYAALQQRYDLITDHIGALEHGFRLGDETGAELASLRGLLEEHTAISQMNSSTEVAHLEQLLEIRAQETNSMARSLDDLKTSHKEQREAMQLLTSSLVSEGHVDPAVIQRLADASAQMEKSRELITFRLQEYERMKQQLMTGLRERSEKLVTMEMTLEEMRDQYQILLDSLSLRSQQKKMNTLERHLEQLVNVQRRLIEQNTTLKKDLAASENRLVARNDRIQDLEADLYSKKEISFSSHLSELTNENEPLSFGRIAKPLRGGKPSSNSISSSKNDSISPKKATGNWFFTA
ncbi:hypothetical protein MYAM1_000253 [Malassezia yamatoensis]|uniref:Kinesin-like protein n=1 Tax=Malassezia yamatoensis TaxID=253288 RepID=A0AAJ5YWB2_9BASI|nr:hypothetical protein MYAM1_000253 [Malassezia yamatoensis]